AKSRTAAATELSPVAGRFALWRVSAGAVVLLATLSLWWSARDDGRATDRNGTMPIVALGLGSMFPGRRRNGTATPSEREQLAGLADGNPNPAMQIDHLGEVCCANAAAKQFLALLANDAPLHDEWRKTCRAMWDTRGEERRFRFAD